MPRFLLLLLLSLSVVGFTTTTASAEPLAHASACPDDEDCDGTPNYSDRCPLDPGPYEGCAQAPDSDRDGVTDPNDACPSTMGTAKAQGCPDADGDGVKDADDACLTRPGPASTQGCGDTDKDGLADNKDACPEEGNDREYPNREPDASGCWPAYVEVAYHGGRVSDVAKDTGGIMSADCDFNHGQRCVAHMTMTLSAKSASALKLSNPRIAAVTIPLTTAAENKAANPPAPRRGKLHLGLSASLRKKIAKLSSLTMTMRLTYTLGSDKPVSAGKLVYNLGRNYSESNHTRLGNIPGFNKYVESGHGDETNLDD